MKNQEIILLLTGGITKNISHVYYLYPIPTGTIVETQSTRLLVYSPVMTDNINNHRRIK